MATAPISSLFPDALGQALNEWLDDEYDKKIARFV